MDDLTGRQLQAAEPLVQLGLDRAAETLAEWIGELDPAEQADGYMDGIEDALNTLLQAGAADPR